MNVILVCSECVPTVEAKLCVFRKYRHLINNECTLIHHKYEDNSEIAKWIAYHKLCCLCETIQNLTSLKVSSTIVREAFDYILTNENFGIASFDIKKSLYTDKMLQEETIKDITDKIGLKIYQKIKEENEAHVVPSTNGGLYARIARRAVQSHMSDKTTEKTARVPTEWVGGISSHRDLDSHSQFASTPALDSEEWKQYVIRRLRTEFLHKKERIVESYMEICAKIQEKLNRIFDILQESKSLCHSTNLDQCKYLHVSVLSSRYIRIYRNCRLQALTKIC